MNPCVSDVHQMFQRFWLAEVADVVAVLPYRDVVLAFTFIPYRQCCHLPGPPVLVDQLPRVRCPHQTYFPLTCADGPYCWHYVTWQQLMQLAASFDLRSDFVGFVFVKVALDLDLSNIDNSPANIRSTNCSIFVCHPELVQ
jgi:hypothetical protein